MWCCCCAEMSLEHHETDTHVIETQANKCWFKSEDQGRCDGFLTVSGMSCVSHRIGSLSFFHLPAPFWSRVFDQLLKASCSPCSLSPAASSGWKGSSTCFRQTSCLQLPVMVHWKLFPARSWLRSHWMGWVTIYKKTDKLNFLAATFNYNLKNIIALLFLIYLYCC